MVVGVPACVASPQPVVGAVHQGAGQVEIGIAAAKEQGRVAGHMDVLEGGHQEGVGLAAAGGAAVEGLLDRQLEELLLLRRRRMGDPAGGLRLPRLGPAQQFGA